MFVAVLVFLVIWVAARVAPAYYAAEVGRFITRDPIEYGGGINLYEYVGARPVHFVDPNGLRLEVVGADQGGMATDLGGVRGRTDVTTRRQNTRCEKSGNCFAARFDYRIEVTLWTLVSSSPRWNAREPQYHKMWGDPRTNAREEQATYHHELDHYETWTKGFANGAQSVNAADGTKFCNQERCNQFRNCVANQLFAFFRQAATHSMKFNGAGWNDGWFQYLRHPFDKTLDLQPCYRQFPPDCLQ
jgi:uncharacterized protein RhaS with RHS repeats